ncbi:hypothetical protein K2X89_01630 [Myxococcota bacterium]|nr:hypothetical protein [Myxococcota bacterium]
MTKRSPLASSERSGNGVEAFRWTESGGLVGLGDLPGGESSFTDCRYCTDFSSYATGTSRDGSVVVGSATSDQGNEPFRWTETAGMVGLGGFEGQPMDSWAQAISADGSVIVGDAATTSGSEAFRWTSTSGMVGLGDVPNGLFDGPRYFIESTATDGSGDGSVIVGTLTYPYEPFDDSSDSTGFVWTERDGMRTVASLLTSLGVDLGGWKPDSAYAISADGRTIVGTAYHRETEQARVYMAVIPEPSSALLVAMGLMVLATRRP